MLQGAIRWIGEQWQGLFICLIVALSAAFLSSQYEIPVLLIALLLGMSSGTLAETPANRPGVDFAAGTILRCGVALLGLRVVISDLAALGWHTVIMLVIGACITIAGGIALARVLRLHRNFGALSGGAVAICGVSAAVAISSVMPRSKAMDEYLAITIVTVTVFGSIAMLFYPALVQLAGFEAIPAGVFLGASIHDVSHVVGAGYSVSPEVGDMAVLAKMVRVTLLVPVVWVFFWAYKTETLKGAGRSKWPLPWFLLVFIALAAIASLDVLPELIRRLADDISRWFLVVAIAALGLKTSVRALLSAGWRPLALVFGESALLGMLVFAFCFGATRMQGAW